MTKKQPVIALSDGGKKHEYLAEMLKGNGYAVEITDEDKARGADLYITPKLKNTHAFEGSPTKVIEYLALGDFKAANGILTAEAALAVAMEHTDFALAGCRALVTGSGAIALPLARRLKALGAFVTVGARNTALLEQLRSEGICAVELCFAGGEYDVIFNTVPALIFDRKMLSTINRDTLIIDLASLPGGVDKAAAEELGISVISALALPGKYMPKTAARVIYTSVLNQIKEEIL